MSAIIDVWVNCPDKACAERIAAAVVGERLAACANILGPISSLYHWRGALEEANEVPLLLKTRAELFEALAAKVRSLHPYEVPSIVAMELTFVDAAYAEWVRAETTMSST